MPQAILSPMLALVLWTFVIWVWMYATRIPAMNAAGIDPGKIKQKGDLDVLPVRVKQIADNYNHLMEQPTLFYATALTLALLGAGAGIAKATALAYVREGAKVELPTKEGAGPGKGGGDSPRKKGGGGFRKKGQAAE